MFSVIRIPMACHCMLVPNFKEFWLLFVCTVELFFRLVNTKMVSIHFCCYQYNQTERKTSGVV